MAWRASVEQWRSLLVERSAGTGLPIEFLLAWINSESGGNQCVSSGMAGIEAGIWQTYHPDDDRFGLTYAQNRAACSGSKLTRALTQAEKVAIVDAGLKYIANRRDRARTALHDIGANWSESSSDFWMLVKLHHVLPAYYRFLPAYKSKQGRAPSSWREFRRWVEGLSVGEFVGLVPAAERWSSAAQRARLFNNAEHIGQHGGGAIAGGMVSLDLALLLGLAAALFFLAR